MTAQLDATLTTEQVTEISWKGQQVALGELGIEQLEDLADDIDYADFQLTRRFQRDNLNSREYRTLLASNDETRETVKAELAQRGHRLCEDCRVTLALPNSDTCRTCWELYQYVD